MVIRTRGRLPDGWGSSPHSLDASASTACHARSPAMTTNKPEVKRYDCTSGGAQHCYGCYTMKESELGDYVEWEAYEALQAECEKLRKDAEFGRSVLSKREPGKVYGCHCDLEE